MSKMRTNILTVGLLCAAAMLPLNLALADQIGSASWYALKSKTANGEQMDPSAMTAAHPSLPFGTRVTVENLTNGRSVVVRINDRGPFVGGRIIDVSKAAASSLGMIGSGTAKVRISATGGAPASEAASTEPSAPAPGVAAVKVAAKETLSRRRVASKHSLSGKRVASASHVRSHRASRDPIRTSRMAAFHRPVHGKVVVASAGSYDILGRTPHFVRSGDIDRPEARRRNLRAFN